MVMRTDRAKDPLSRVGHLLHDMKRRSLTCSFYSPRLTVPTWPVLLRY